LQQKLDSGVGIGGGPKYEAWKTSENTTTVSHSGKFFSELTERYMHFLGETEEGVLLSVLRMNDVEEVLENYRLSIPLTERICLASGRKHPRSEGPGKPLVPFTTDTLFKRRAPPQFVAVSASDRGELRNPRDAYKSLFVQHVYWQLHSVPLFFVTNFDLPRETIRSLSFINPSEEGGTRPPAPQLEIFLQLALRADWSRDLLLVVRDISSEMRIDSTLGMKLFKVLAWENALECDLSRELSASTRNAVRPR